MKIALLGAKGQLAFDLKRVLAGHELVAFTRADFDVTDRAAARDCLLDLRPDAIINTTAFHQVDLCESRPDDAFGVNAIAVFHLARCAQEIGARLVHISSDYVFDGDSRRPYSEEDIPRPISVYANSKLAGEYFIQSECEKHILIRTCGLYGAAGLSGKGHNFVESMLQKSRTGEGIRVVEDQVVTPTPTVDLARQLECLLGADQYGLFHCTAEGSCSWFEFARAIFELSGLLADLEPTDRSVYKTPARRPAYSVLDNARLNELGLNRMRHWRTGLADYLFEKHGFTGVAARRANEHADSQVR